MRFFLFFLGFFWLMACQPMKYISVDEEEVFESLGDENPFRKGEQYFVDKVSSDKLDLVIVLDTQYGLENFYKENIFGSDFLTSFKSFDWRVAYTNSSVSEDFFQDLTSENEEVKKTSGCKELVSSGVKLSLVGALLSSPHVLLTGIGSLLDCVSNIRNKKRKKTHQGVDGEFLSFEHDKKKVKLKGNYLTKEVKNYNDIFNDTMVLRPKKKWSKSYEAPIIQGEKSNPLISFLFSFATNFKQKEAERFFREDSRIVYVVVTPEDAKIDIEGDKLEKALKYYLKEKNRFQLIPVTLQEEDVFCQVKFQEMGFKKAVPALKLQNISKELGTKSLDICSSNLGEELAVEIKTYLYATETL